MTTRARLLELRRRVPPAVWCITALYAALLCAYALTLPTYQAPDEPHHVDAVRAVAGGLLPAHGERNLSAQVTESLPLMGYFEVPEVRRGDVPAPNRDERPPFGAIAEDRPSIALNHVTQHPPLYYLAAGGVLAVVEAAPGAMAFDTTVGTLRLLNVLLAAPLPLLVYAAARRLSDSTAAAVAASAFPLAVPQLVHVSSSVNNDAALVIVLGGLTLCVAAIAAGDTSRRTALLAGTIAGVAMLVKGFAIIGLAWIGAAYALAAVRRAGGVRLLLGRAALAVALATAVGGWWWLRNVLVAGRVFPIGGEGIPDLRGEGFSADIVLWSDIWRRSVAETFWGLFGWFDAGIPEPLVWAAAAVVLVAIVGAFVRGPSGDRWWRADVALMLLPILTLMSAMAWRSWADYGATGTLVGVQGRYLYTGLPGLAVAAALGASTVAGRARRWAPLAVLSGALLLHLAAALSILNVYWVPPDVTGLAARASVAVGSILAWSPWPVGMTAVAGVALLLALPAAIVSCVRLGLDDVDPPVGAPAEQIVVRA